MTTAEIDPFAAPTGADPLDDEWSAPKGGGDMCAPADVLGHLLVVRPLEYVEGIVTTMGDSDAIRVNVADLDTGKTYGDALWFQTVLRNGLRRQIGTTVLGRMGQGVAKKGQSAPWILENATGDAEALKKAKAFKVAHPEFWK